MKNYNSLCRLLLFLPMLALFSGVAAQSETRQNGLPVTKTTGKSNIIQTSYNRLDCIPAQGMLCCLDSITDNDVMIRAGGGIGSGQHKSRFTVVSKSGGSNTSPGNDAQRSFVGHKKSDKEYAAPGNGAATGGSAEVSVLNAAGVFQAPNTWYLQKEGDILVVNLSGLPKGKYKISMKTSSGVEEFEVASDK